MSQQHDSDALAKIDNCSHEGSVRNAEDISSLQLELNMLKKARAEAEDRAAALGDELKEACRQKESTEKKLKIAELNLIDMTKELNELNKNNFQSPVFHKMYMETSRLKSALNTHCRNEYVPYEDPEMQTFKFSDSEDSPLGTKLKRMRASLEKACKLNTWYQQHQASCRSAEHEKYEVSKEVEIAVHQVMICQLKSQLDQSDRCYKVRLKELEIKMQELKVEALASLASWNKEREMLEQSKADLEVDVCELERKVNIMKEEAEHQRRQQGKIEVELQNVRQQLRAVTSSGKAGSFLEDGMVDLSNATRYQSEGRIFEREVSVEPAPQVEHPKDPFSDQYTQEVNQSDVEMEKAPLDMDYWSDNSKFEHPSATEELEQISASKQPELFGSGAYSDQCLSACDSEQVRPPESVIEVLNVNELPPVAPVRLSDPVNYMRARSDELKKLRSKNHYEGPRTATDSRFWSIEQQDLYTSVYSRAKLSDMFIDWVYINSKDHFASVREQCAHLGLELIMSYHCDWNSELIKQFYSTVWISPNKSKMTFMADGRMITVNKRAWEVRFGILGGVQTEIHSQFLLDDDDKRTLFTDAECTLGQISGLSPLASIANKIIRTTIYPRNGNTIHSHNWNILHHIVEQRPFDIIALIFGEIELLISDRSRTKDLLLYAPYIMAMIMGAFEYDGPRESKHHFYKPRHSNKLKRTKRDPPAPPVAAPSERPPSTFQPEVEAHVDADHHSQPQGEGEAVKGQTVLAEAITRTDLLQVIEDGLRPIRDSLASMEGRIGRFEDGPGLPVQHTYSSSSQSPAPHSSLALPLQATTPAPPLVSAASSEQASRMHADNSSVPAQPAHMSHVLLLSQFL